MAEAKEYHDNTAEVRSLSLMRHHAQAAIDALHKCEEVDADKAYIFLKNAMWNIERGLVALSKKEEKE